MSIILRDATNAGNLAEVTSSQALKVDGSAVTQPVSLSGTVAVTQSGSWSVSVSGTASVAGTLTHNSAAPTTNNIGVLPAVASTASPTYNAGDQVLLSTDLSGNLRTTSTFSGELTNNITEWNSQSLGSPSNFGSSPGTVAVIGTNASIFAGTTGLSATTEGSPAENSLNVHITNTSGVTVTGTVAATQSGSWSVTANAGTGTFSTQDAASVAQSSTTSGQDGILVQGAVTTSAPTYTTGKTDPLSLDTSGNLRTSVNNTVTVSGTVTAEIEGHGGATLDAAPGAAAPTNGLMVGGSDGTDFRAFATDTSGQQKVLLENSIPAGTNSIGTVVLGAGSATIGTVDIAASQTIAVTQATAANLNATVAQGTAAAGTAGWPVVGGNTTESTASWTSATSANTTLAQTITGYGTVVLSLAQGSTLTGGAVTFEVSDTSAGTNWYAISGSEINGTTTASNYTLNASTNQGFLFNVAGWVQFRVRLSTTISGSGTVAVGIAAMAFGGGAAAGAAGGSSNVTIVGPVDGSGYVEVDIKASALTDAAEGTPGSAAPSQAIQVGGSDGTDLRVLFVNSSGFAGVTVENSTLAVTQSGTWTVTAITNAVTVEGNVANGSAVSGANAPVLVAGSDGTDVRTLSTNSSGQLVVALASSQTLGTVTTVSAVTSITNAVTVVGDAANGSALSGNPVLVAGSDGTDARAVATDTSGNLTTRPQGTSKVAQWSHAVINISAASGSQTLVSAVSSQTIRIMKIQFTVNAAVNFFFLDSTPTTLSGTYILTGNGSSYSDFSNGEPLYITGSDKAFEINLSTTATVGGDVWYTQS